MKTMNLFISGMMALALAAGCTQKEVLPEVQEGPSGELTYLTASTAATKAAFSEEGEGTWSEGDSIAVYTSESAFCSFALTAGSGTSTGTFGGDLGDASTSKLAVYPYNKNHSLAETALTVHLPASYEWNSNGNSHLPMLAQIEEDGAEELSFKHLAALVKFTFSDVPEKASKFVFTAAGKKVNGDFTIADYTAEGAQIETSDTEEDEYSSVTYTFKAGTASEMTFYVPLPVGTYNGFKVELIDALGNVLTLKTRYKDFTVQLADLKLIKAIAGAATNGKKMYFDFGKAASASTSESVITESPDVNRNYWNNITMEGKGTSFDLVYADNAATGYTLTLTTAFDNNGITHGGLTDPDATYLGDLAIATATEDYFFSSGTAVNTFTINGLNPAKGYQFYIFGSRAAKDVRVAKYIINGNNTWSGTLQIAGEGIGKNGGNGNDSEILESDIIYPASDGSVTFSLTQGDTKTSNRYYQLNCMKIVEYEGGSVPNEIDYTSATISGAAASEGEVSMHRAMTTNDDNIFETVTTFASGELTITAVDNYGDTHTLTYDCSTDGVALFTLDLDNDTYTFTELGTILCQGSALEGWSTSNGAELTYQGKGVFSGESLSFAGTKYTSATAVSDASRFNFLNKGSWTPTFKRVSGTRRDIEVSGNGSTEDIRINPGTYNVSLDLQNFNFDIEYAGDSEYRITAMGSSVPRGYTATDYYGYMYLYEDIIQDYSSNPWYISNISVASNSTVSLLNRYDELQVDGGDYVIYALSLGNEGIHGASDQDAIYNQFKTNMQTLISKAEADGKTVVVTGNYARADFTDTDYEYIKKMNLEIYQWDVPTVNLLGAIDNGSGQWADGYDAGDTYHPNNAGHIEMGYTLVPSLFDALKSGKTLCTERTTSGSYSIGSQKLSVKPENKVHPFAITFAVKTSGTGDLLVATDSLSTAHTLSINSDGCLEYEGKAGSTAINDGNWHYVTMTYSYARGLTTIYLDSDLQISVEESKFVAGAFTISDPSGSSSFRELFFWRSSLNAGEVAAVLDGKMLKGSLEIYSPLNGSVENLAMSTNTITIN